LNNTVIRELVTTEKLFTSVQVIRDSFKTVADDFGLTKENCPTHPSFITTDQLNYLQSRGSHFFGLFEEDVQIGFIAVEKENAELYYIEKLAVLPECRHKGYGASLVKHSLDYIKENGWKKVSIGIINEHTILKQWYMQLGFREISVKRYPHLPFTVCFMEIHLGDKR